MKPKIGLAQSILPSLMEPILRNRLEMLLAKSRPLDQVPLVDFECAIEPGIEDRGQRDHTSRRIIFLTGEDQADPDDDLGRTKIDAARRDFDLRIAEE